jgi:hypothetical protein
LLGLGAGLGYQELVVHAKGPDGGGAYPVDQGHQVFIHFLDKHHVDDLHGLGVSDAETFVEDWRDVDTLQPLVDLGSTIVDEDGMKANVGEKNEVVDDGGLVLLRLHGCSPIFDHDSLSPEFLDEWQRFR